MLDRQHGKILFECDGCGEVLQTDTGDFTAALALMKSDGWSNRRLGRGEVADWNHYCPKCKPTFADPFGVFGERHR